MARPGPVLPHSKNPPQRELLPVLMPLPLVPALHNDPGPAALPGAEEEANNGDRVKFIFVSQCGLIQTRVACHLWEQAVMGETTNAQVPAGPQVDSW